MPTLASARKQSSNVWVDLKASRNPRHNDSLLSLMPSMLLGDLAMDANGSVEHRDWMHAKSASAGVGLCVLDGAARDVSAQRGLFTENLGKGNVFGESGRFKGHGSLGTLWD